jgi:hypothetical protein
MSYELVASKLCPIPVSVECTIYRYGLPCSFPPVLVKGRLANDACNSLCKFARRGQIHQIPCAEENAVQSNALDLPGNVGLVKELRSTDTILLSFNNCNVGSILWECNQVAHLMAAKDHRVWTSIFFADIYCLATVGSAMCP